MKKKHKYCYDNITGDLEVTHRLYDRFDVYNLRSLIKINYKLKLLLPLFSGGYKVLI